MKHLMFLTSLLITNTTNSFASTNCQKDAEKVVTSNNKVTIDKSREIYASLHPESAVEPELYLVYTKERKNFVVSVLPKYERGKFVGNCKGEYVGSFQALPEANPKLLCRDAAEKRIKAKEDVNVSFSRELFQELHPGIVAEREVYVVYASDASDDIDFVVVVKPEITGGESAPKCKVEYARQFGDPSVHPAKP